MLLQVVFHARVAEEAEADAFDIDTVAGLLVEKLVRRHPHVFADGDASTPAEVEQAWERIKAAGEGRRRRAARGLRGRPAARHPRHPARRPRGGEGARPGAPPRPRPEAGRARRARGEPGQRSSPRSSGSAPRCATSPTRPDAGPAAGPGCMRTVDRVNDPVGEAPAMAGYGVGGPGWQPLPWSWAAERLAGARNFWMVTRLGHRAPARAAGLGGVGRRRAPVRVLVLAELPEGGQTSPPTRRCTFDPGDTVECVSVEGRALRVDEGARLDDLGRAVPREVPAACPRTCRGTSSGPTCLIEVVPERAFAIIEREDEFADRATRWRF